ncbi:MAG: hypothetical protein SPJ71_05480 [Candidatus Limisoma sp.]|nr:hypothetical protein [Bacteroidales bacterium]MDY5894008.1 hypothetical protein [Candidatus Limisoma sp.]
MENEVVVFADLVALLAKSTGTTEALCDSFLRELLALGVEKLTSGNDFLVKGLGTFRLICGEVVFEIDNSFADELNSAFDCFEPIELDDDFDEELFGEAVQETAQPTEPVQPTTEELEDELPPLPADEPETYEPQPEDISIDEPQVDEPDVLPPPIPEEDRLQPSEVSVAVTEEPSTDETIKEADSDANTTNTATPDYDAEYGYDDDSSSSKPRWQLFVYGIVCGIVVAVIAYFALAYFGILPTTQEQNVVVDTQIPSVADDTVVIDTIYPIKPHAVDTVSAQDADEAKVVETEKEPEAKPVTCKVQASTTLCDLARRYYGDYHFWIYIYQENREKIKDPNNLQSGIVLVIPPAEKYGIDANNQESIDKAAAAIDALK